MPRLSSVDPFIHPDCDITDSTFGAYVEIGRGSRLNNATFGDYAYCDRYADIANARIGKFAHIGHDTWIGAGAMIKPEVTLGRGAVVAAGAAWGRPRCPRSV